jgi:hypothetical protein
MITQENAVKICRLYNEIERLQQELYDRASNHYESIVEIPVIEPVCRVRCVKDTSLCKSITIHKVYECFGLRKGFLIIYDDNCEFLQIHPEFFEIYNDITES